MTAPITAPADPPCAFRSALIVDDHPLFCDALALTLAAVAGLARTQTADSLAAATEHLARARFDLVLLDLNLPDASGLDGLVRLRLSADGAPILVVSSQGEPRLIAAALQAGAAGFVPKHAGRDTFRRALEALGEGRSFVPEGLPAAPSPADNRREEVLDRLSELTPQQARILELICAGKLNKQIAFDLSIADATVKAHVTGIMRKLGVQTRTQAVLLAREVSFGAILRG